MVRFVRGVAQMTGLSIDSPGTVFSLRFSLPAMGIESVTSSSFSVCGPASLAYLDMQPPSRVPYQQPFGAVLNIRDANKVPVDTDGVIASVKLADPSTCLETEPPVLSGQLLRAALGGEAHFTDLAIARAFPCSLRICFQLDPGATAIPHLLAPNICTEDFSVIHGSPDRLSLLAPIPTFTSAAVLLPKPQLSITDRAGNLVQDFTGSIRAVLYDKTDSAVPAHTFEAAVSSGVASLDIIVETPGDGYRFQFEAVHAGDDAIPNLWSQTFEVEPGPVANLVVRTQPGPGIAGLPLSRPAVVAAVDQGGFVATSFAGLVVAYKSSGEAGGNAVLEGKLTAVAENGLATFNGLVINETDTSFVIRFATDSNCGMDVLSAPVIITTQATSFTQVTPAGGGQGGAVMSTQPRFQALDARLETAILAAGFVCARLAPWQPTTGVLTGTQTAPFVDGFAQFTDLAIDKKDTYTLVFDLVLAESSAVSGQTCQDAPLAGSVNQTGFTVGTGQVATMRLEDPFPSITILPGVTGGMGLSISPVITLFDAGGNQMVDDFFSCIRVGLEYQGYKAHPPSLEGSGKQSLAAWDPH